MREEESRQRDSRGRGEEIMECELMARPCGGNPPHPALPGRGRVEGGWNPGLAAANCWVGVGVGGDGGCEVLGMEEEPVPPTHTHTKMKCMTFPFQMCTQKCFISLCHVTQRCHGGDD